jgi:hypothetical protein
MQRLFCCPGECPSMSIHRSYGWSVCRARCARARDAWQVGVLGGRHPVTGRKRWISKTVRGGKRAAQREMAMMIAEVDKSLATGTDATFADLIERWLERFIDDEAAPPAA